MSNLEIFSNQDFVKIFKVQIFYAHLVDFTLFDTIDAFRYNLKYRSIQFSKQFFMFLLLFSYCLSMLKRIDC